MTASGRDLLLTLGDPNGLGPELASRIGPLLPERFSFRRVLVIGSEEALQQHCRRLGIMPFWTRLEDPFSLAGAAPGIYCHTPVQARSVPFTPGEATVGGGLSAGASLETACQLLGRGVAAALVTGPLSKEMLQQAGFDFPGHTEFLARSFGLGPEEVCMHLAGPELRVSLATTHHSLRAVPGMISTGKIVSCLRLTWDLMRSLGLDELPVAVCGLNPHAGEGGRIGGEERDIIRPAVEAARAEGIDAAGPFPADTVFLRAARGEFSAVLAMYHDQGLAPLKLLHFGRAVNMTLGLPVVRTSVDHGTGFDLAGRGEADPASLLQALAMAERLLAAQGRGGPAQRESRSMAAKFLKK
jgi:4-hydroxythreonine-4-phosphate dehydrogenase